MHRKKAHTTEAKSAPRNRVAHQNSSARVTAKRYAVIAERLQKNTHSLIPLMQQDPPTGPNMARRLHYCLELALVGRGGDGGGGGAVGGAP